MHSIYTFQNKLSFSRGSDISNFIRSDQKVAPYLVVFQVITPKSDFLLIGAETTTPKGFHKQKILEKLCSSFSKIMNNKKVFVYGLLESTNDLRSIFVGHIDFKKLMKI